MKDRDRPLVVLLETEDPAEADIVRSKLEAFDIPCIIRNESAGHLFGIMLDGLARTKILVPEDCLELAREALKPGELDSPDEET